MKTIRKKITYFFALLISVALSACGGSKQESSVVDFTEVDYSTLAQVFDVGELDVLTQSLVDAGFVFVWDGEQSRTYVRNDSLREEKIVFKSMKDDVFYIRYYCTLKKVGDVSDAWLVSQLKSMEQVGKGDLSVRINSRNRSCSNMDACIQALEVAWNESGANAPFEIDVEYPADDVYCGIEFVRQCGYSGYSRRRNFGCDGSVEFIIRKLPNVKN